MPLPEPHQWPLVLLLILPGFISRKVYELRVPSQAGDGGRYLTDALFYGVLNLGLWVVPLAWLLQRFDGQLLALVIIAFSAFVLSPVILGNLTVAALSSPRLRGWILHPAPTSWDYFFGLRKPCWVLFRLRGGKSIAGYFGTHSFASSFPHRRDVYIEQVWVADESGRFTQPIPDSAGALISMDDCELVEFFEVIDESGRTGQDGKQAANTGTSSPSGGISAG